MGVNLSKLKSPTYKKCENPDCNEMFWGYAVDKYHCENCRAHTQYLKNKKNVYRWREKHPEKMKGYTVKYKDRMKKYQNTHKREIKKYWKTYYNKNKAAISERRKLKYRQKYDM